MKRSTKDISERKLKSLGRELNKLQNEHIKGVGWEEYPTPIHHGYIRTYQLRDDVAKRKDAIHLQRILDLINVEQFCFDKSFKSKIRYLTASRFAFGRYNNNDIELNKLNKGHYDKLFTGDDALPQRFQNDFDIITRVSTWGGQQYSYYQYRKDWQFKIVIRKNMVTRVKLYDNELESKIDEIENYITTHNLWYDIFDYWSRRYDDWEDNRSKFIDKYEKMKMKEDLKDYNN